MTDFWVGNFKEGADTNVRGLTRRGIQHESIKRKSYGDLNYTETDVIRQHHYPSQAQPIHRAAIVIYLGAITEQMKML